jgi:tetratricopeptide (TPR) repeat protein
MKKIICRSQILFLVIFTANIPIFAQSQSNNSIAGFVFAGKRQPLSQINVELLDEFGRLIGHVATDSSGRYTFYRVAAGKYQIRVMASHYGYEEQVQEAEIVNFLRQTSSGNTRFSGSENVQINFYLNQRKNTTTADKMLGVVFAQEVPEEAQKYYKQAVSDLNQQRNDEGLRALEQAVEIFPTYFYALERLGQEYVNRQQFGKAEITLKRAVAVNPKSYQSWYSLSYTFYSTKQFDEALKAANKSIEINNTLVEARLLMGVLFRQNKQYKEAETQLKKAKEFAKVPVPDVHWQLALLYNYNLKEYNLAADELELYLKAKPDKNNEEAIKKLIIQLRQKANK